MLMERYRCPKTKPKGRPKPDDAPSAADDEAAMAAAVDARNFRTAIAQIRTTQKVLDAAAKMSPTAFHAFGALMRAINTTLEHFDG
jgi:hypothetical protein